jgi:uncharacterized protein (TIGR03437 family)
MESNLLQPRATCTPNAVVPNFTHPLDQSMTPQVAVTQKVQVKIVDSCNNLVTAVHGGAAQVTFSNKDAVLDLQDIGSGIWEGAWTPANPAMNANVQVVATAGGAGLNAVYGGTKIGVTVQPAAPDAAALPTGVVNAAAAAQAMPNIVVPCSYVAIYGSGMASTGTPGATTLPLPTNLNGTQLLLGEEALPLAYASPGQVNGLIPCNLNSNTSYGLVIQRGSTGSVGIPVTLAELQPGIYTEDQSGSGQGAIQIAGTALLAAPLGYAVSPGSPVPSQPAQRGTDYLVIYGTGFGPVQGTKGEPAPADGTAASLPTVYQTTNTVTVTVGGVNAPVVFSGLTPTLVALYQVNALVPAGAPSGSAVPVVVTVTDSQTRATVQSNTVTIAIQ